MKILSGSALLLLLGTPAFAAPKVGDPAPPLDVHDVKDRPLKVPETGSVLVLSFASKSNAEDAGAITRTVRAHHPEAKIYSFIDLSGFPGFLHGTVKKKVLAKQPGAVKDATAEFVKAGKTPPADVDALVHIITDFDESSCKAYGATDTGHKAEIVVVGPDGKVAAAWETLPTLAEVDDAVAKVLPAAK